jgi:septal ring factor EnvC (AmiA/AmiB activator)
MACYLFRIPKGLLLLLLFCGCAKRYEQAAPVEYPNEQETIEEDETIDVQPLEPAEEQIKEEPDFHEEQPLEDFSKKDKPIQKEGKEIKKEKIKEKSEEKHKTESEARTQKRASGLIWPIKGKIVTYFGDQSSKKEDSNSITIQTAPNLRIKAAASGKVTQVTFLPDIGKVVILDHGDGKYSVYSSLKEASVKKGAEIKQGSVIGRTDRKPFSFRLYERKKGKKIAVDPLKYLPKGN